MIDILRRLGRYNKFMIAALAALGVYLSVRGGGLTDAELSAVISAGLGALGVVSVGNAAKPPAR